MPTFVTRTIIVLAALLAQLGPGSPSSALRFPSVPGAVVTTVLERVRNLPLPEVSDPSSLQFKLALPHYDISMESLAAVGNLDAATSANRMRLLLASGGKSIAWADITMNGSSVSRVDRYAAANATGFDNAFAKLGAMEQVRQGSFEVRLLNLPAGLVGPGGVYEVLWLKSATSGGDWIYTLDSAVPPQRAFAPGHLFTTEEFLNVAKPLAQAVRARPPAPRGSTLGF